MRNKKLSHSIIHYYNKLKFIIKLQWRLRYIERNFSCFVPKCSGWFLCSVCDLCNVPDVQCEGFFYKLFLLNGLKEGFIFCISNSRWTLGFYFFLHLSSCKTVLDTCSICTCPGDQSCAFQLDLLPGGCCLAVLGHVRSGESSCVKVKVWHLREDCFSIATISY